MDIQLYCTTFVVYNNLILCRMAKRINLVKQFGRLQVVGIAENKEKYSMDVYV